MKTKSPIKSFKKALTALALMLLFMSVCSTSPTYASPNATETEEGAFFPIATPTAFKEEIPLQTQEAERQVAPSQAMQEANSYVESIWPAFNISDTDTASIDPVIAVDTTGKIHMVWAEAEEGTKWEIYYAYWDGELLSQSVSA